jgi:hypothetical protein
VMLTYSPAIYAAGMACLIAAVSIFLLRKPGISAVPVRPAAASA